MSLAIAGIVMTPATVASAERTRFPTVTGDHPALGQPVLLEFWATWCQPCVAEMPLMVSFARENPNVRVLLVSVDESEAALRRHMRGREGSALIVHDPRHAWVKKYSIVSYPTRILVAADGREICRSVGSMKRPDGTSRMQTWLQACLAVPEEPPPANPAIGPNGLPPAPPN
jgi:thiol-disulfide isomerase/thioredoxin